MQRRGESEQPVKARKVSTANTPTDQLPEQFDRLRRERDEALEQQAATVEVLRAISSSVGKLEPIFETMLRNALRLCGAQFGHMLLFDGEAFTIAAMKDTPAGFAKHLLAEPKLRVYPGSYLAQLVETKKTIHVPDLRADKPYLERQPRAVAAVDQGGLRSQLMVPMIKEDKLIGSINIYRQQLRPFTERQIGLVESFAAQAVIAIENTRLLSELRESLQQQTATSEVLKVISSSLNDLKPVFETIAQSAEKLCNAQTSLISMVDGDQIRLVSINAATEEGADAVRRVYPMRRDAETVIARTIRSAAICHIPDVLADALYQTKDAARVGGYRACLGVPMIRDGQVIGAILVARSQPGLFADSQVQLLKTFADQAVVAVENVRLFNETKEALAQQTATADVLKIISSSPGELEPVFQAMLANAVRICEAKFGGLVLFEGNAYRRVALHNAPAAYIEEQARDPVRPLAASPTLSRVAGTKQVIHITDIRAEQPEEVIATLGGARTILCVPMLKDDQVVGVISIYRQEVCPFTDKQIELVKNFAAQAVIAIENTRLLNELRQRTDDLSESLQQQTATSEVLKVISSSPGELQPVFEAMLQNATRICGAGFGGLFRIENGQFEPVAYYNLPEALEKHLTARGRIKPRPGSTMERVMRTKDMVHVVDLWQDADGPENPASKYGNARTLLGAPMLKDDKLIGAIVIYRQEVRPFSDKQIELVTNFAAQAVIAVENTRLLNELRESLQQQTATAEVLKVISSSSGELNVVFEAMLENAVRICGATFGNLWQRERDGFRIGAMHNTPQPYVDYLRSQDVFHPDPRVGLGLVLRTKEAFQLADIAAAPTYGDKTRQALIELAGARTLIAVPMLKDNEVVGAIGIYRQEVRPFTDKQIELVKNFASQAVIAIENTRLLNELRQRTDDLSEALEQQTATSEVLKVISSSPGELEPVFQAMLENATRICNAKFGNLYLCERDTFQLISTYGLPPAIADDLRRAGPRRPPPNTTALGRLAATKRTAHIADALSELSDLNPPPGFTGASLINLAGARTVLGVPMLKDDELVGAIVVYRTEVRPFTDKQIELVSNFAAQAVIAIENTRLLSELRQRTDALSESLDRQTAMSEVLGVISSSPTDLTPVFDTILANATRLCEGNLASLWRYDGEFLIGAAQYNASPAFVEHYMGTKLKPEPAGPARLAAFERRTVHVADITAEPGFTPIVLQYERARTVLAVPLLRDEDLVGVIAIWRREVHPFTDQQIALVRTFADQAVIAIENARLLNELRESLQQQTATADVLKVISRSTFDLQTVLDTLVESATRLCEAKDAFIFLRKGELYHVAARYGFSSKFQEYLGQHPRPPARGSVTGRTALEGKVVHVPDVMADPEYTWSEAQQIGGYRTVLGVPLLRDGNPVGVIIVARTVVQPFSEKQIELVTTFADQAVIAIENVRLFDEVQARTRDLSESLQQQTATSDVLKAISRSAFDLQTVLQTLVESTARLCDADQATILREKDGAFYRAEAYGFTREFMDYVKDIPIQAERGSASGRALLEGRVVHIADVKVDPEYTLVEAQRLGDYRTILCVPMLRDGAPIGVLILTRSEVRPFTDKQIELVTTFADQAAIAIENVRLFESVEARTRELAKSLENLHTTQDRLVQTQKLASLGQLTAGIAHEIKNPLNFVNNFSGVSAELIDELQEALTDVSLNEKRRSEITELMDTLRGNLDKVMQHGKRADAIVKNMLLHSREGLGEHRLVDINAIVEESLNLAYHGARAEKQGFNITLQRSLDPAAGEVDVFPQDITRVLLNLISNGFYAATKRRAETNGGDYEPTLAAATRSLGDRVEITIRDNGTGIPPDVKEKMFNPFFTTKPAGEGTGLGLSISHDIIVKQHGGSIEVDTQPGEFSEFRIILPRAAVFLAESGGRV